jgi:hypothetical protein
VLLEWGGGGINLVSAIEDKNVSLTCWEFFVAKSVLLFNLLLEYYRRTDRAGLYVVGEAITVFCQNPLSFSGVFFITCFTFSLRNKYFFKACEIKSLLSVGLNFFIRIFNFKTLKNFINISTYRGSVVLK